MHHFARRLVENGHQVTVITEMPNHPKGVIFDGYRGRGVLRTREDGIEVIRVWIYTSPRKTVARRVLFYNTYMINVIFATSPPLPVILPAYVASRLKRCPYVMDVRDIWPAVGVVLGEIRGPAVIRAAEQLERFLYRNASAITCVTRSFVEDVVSKGANPHNVYFLPNGTIPEIFTPKYVDGGLRRRLGLEGKFVIGFCGNHGVAQGLPEVLEAACLLKEDERFFFLFVGEGPVKPRLLEMKERHGLRNVLLLPQVPITEITPFINVADVMLVPLKRDGIFTAFIPSKMFDFMACGKAIILTVDGEARSILEEAGAGVYVKPDNPQALVSAILNMAERPDALDNMGRRGREYVLQHYVRDQQAKRLEEILTVAANTSLPG